MEKKSKINSKICETPDAIVENGRIHSGFFKTPFRRLNLLDAPNMGGSLGKPMRWFRLKEWVGFGLGHPRLFGAMIIQDAKYATSGTVYFYDRETRKMDEWLAVDLPGRAKLPETLWQGRVKCGLGKNWIDFDHDLSKHRHHVRANFKAGRGRPSLELDLVLHQDMKTYDPLVVSLSIQPDHHTYTHKSPLRIEGTVRIGGREFRFDPARDMGNLDEQKTFYPYRSHWYWGSFIGPSTSGREVMINLVDQMTPKGEPGEDAMWVDGRLMLIDPAAFIPETGRGNFRLEDREGRVRLRFEAEGSKAEKRNFLVAALDYEQFYGRYDGVVVDDKGTEHTIKGLFGALERMSARF